MKKDLQFLQAKKLRGERISMLTCYDFPTAQLQEEAGVDVLLVGDSVGTNILGYASEKEVTVDDIVHHLQAVRRGVRDAYVLGDLPYNSYLTSDQALTHARRLIAAGADGVKLEGALPEIIRHLSDHGIEVCAHLGYTPQTAASPGYRAKSADKAVRLLNDCLALEAAGAGWIVLETVTEEAAKQITERLRIPTIGIGAGRYVDGQVLLIVDLLGITPKNFVHNRQYLQLRDPIRQAIAEYTEDVRNGRFPSEDNVRHMAESESTAFAEFTGKIRVNS